MNTRFATSALAIIISLTLVAPSALLFSPGRAYAVLGVPTVEMNPIFLTAQTTTAAETAVGTAESIFQSIQQVLTQVHSYTSMVAEWAQYINTYVLQPLAFVLSGNLMKQLTASVIQFVVGKANSTGVPQFVVDVQRSTRDVADGQALAYLKNVNKTKSPFSGSIAKALNTDYLTRSSLKGFWESNMNSLDKSSPNVTSYLRGSWSQGGVSAWFSLTTQTQNNPFALYQNAQNKLDVHVGPGVGGVTGKRTSEIGWGSGFMSWCGDLSTEVAANVAENDAVFSGYTTVTDCTTNGGDWNTASNSCVSPSGPTGVNPGDTCVDKNGNQGTIKTPGSVIKATLDKVLGGQQDEIVRMGNIGPEINGILSDIGAVMKTVMFASDILGGATGSNGGLLSAGNPASSNGQRLAQFMPTQNGTGSFTSGYLGASNANIISNSPQQPEQNTSRSGNKTTTGGTTSMTDRVKMYTDGWEVAFDSTNTASSSLNSLIGKCTTAISVAKNDPSFMEPQLTIFVNAATKQVADAQSALTTAIAPVLVKAASVAEVASAALAMDTKVKAELASGDPLYAADSLTLNTMPPTVSDALAANENTFAYLDAEATPEGSLNVTTYKTVVDQMGLISKNAKALELSVCTPQPAFSFPIFNI